MYLLHDYINATVNLYGLIHKEKLLEIHNMQNNDAINLVVVDKVMAEDAKELESFYTFIEDDYFVHESIVLFDDINEILLERMGKPFYIPTKNELLKYKDELYFEKSKHYRELLRYVTKYLTNGNRQQASELCEEIQLICQNDFMPSDIIAKFNRMDIVFNYEDEVRHVLDMVMNLANNTRL